MLKEFLKTPEQELQEVGEGKKPAALGNWEELSDGILSYKLMPTYGRFYEMAIAKTKENLARVVMAYYMPLSLEADIELGRALGYDEKDIIEYTKTQVYPLPLPKLTKQQRTYFKIRAEIEKIGIKKVVDETIKAIKGDANSKHLIVKEGLDLDYAIEILLLILKEEKC